MVLGICDLSFWLHRYRVWDTNLGISNSRVSSRRWVRILGFSKELHSDVDTRFWFFGFHIIKSLGNRITQMSPSRGYSVELGAAITVLLASRLSLPVSTTQCLVGATMGVALMNFSLGAANWRQLLFIFCGWVLTLPCAGLIAGLLMTMSLNTPHF